MAVIKRSGQNQEASPAKESTVSWLHWDRASSSPKIPAVSPFDQSLPAPFETEFSAALHRQNHPFQCAPLSWHSEHSSWQLELGIEDVTVASVSVQLGRHPLWIRPMLYLPCAVREVSSWPDPLGTHSLEPRIVVAKASWGPRGTLLNGTLDWKQWHKPSTRWWWVASAFSFLLSPWHKTNIEKSFKTICERRDRSTAPTLASHDDKSDDVCQDWRRI